MKKSPVKKTVAVFGFVLLAGAVLCSAPALAGTCTFTYGFDRGNEGWVSGQTPNGKDNWTGATGNATMTANGTAFSTLGRAASWYPGSPNTNSATNLTRTNNAAWGYSIPSNATALSLYMDAQGAYIGSSLNQTDNRVSLIQGTTTKLTFGGLYTTGSPYYKWVINSTYSTAVATNKATELRLDCDLTANVGAGSGSLYARTPEETGPDFVAVAGLQSINLGLTPGNWAAWDGLRIRLNRNAKMDYIRIVVTAPYPALGATPSSGSTILFGDVPQGQSPTLQNCVSLANIGDPGTTVQLLGATGFEGTKFSIARGNPGNSIPAGQQEVFDLKFNSTGLPVGLYSKSVTFNSDQGAVTYTLTANVVLAIPEPAGLGLIGLGVLAGLLRRQRRS